MCTTHRLLTLAIDAKNLIYVTTVGFNSPDQMTRQSPPPLVIANYYNVT